MQTIRLMALPLMLLLAACSQQDASRIVDAQLVIENVSVISMETDTVVPGQSVFVSDGVITEIAPANEVSTASTAVVVDGSGKYLIPGLADMHVHIWSDSDLPLYVANGVTLVRNMWGAPETLAMQNRVQAGITVGPRIVTAGQLVDGDPPIWGEYSGVARNAKEARDLMHEQQAAGYDFFKIYALLDLETFNGIAGLSAEMGFPFAGHVPDAVPLEHALLSEMASIEHLTGWEPAVTRPDSGYLTRQQEPDRQKRRANNTVIAGKLVSGEVTYDDLFDREEARRLAEIASYKRVWNVPTLAVLKRIVTSRRQAVAEFERPEMRYMSPGTRSSWDPSTDFRLKDYSDDELEALQALFGWDLELVGILHEAGAPMLAGTDAPNPFVVHGFAIHEELQFFVDAGLSPYEALLTATRAPAVFLGELDSAGTIAVGKRADLVLLDADPLSDIAATRNPAGVVANGVWRSRQDLAALLDAIAASYEKPDDWFEGIDPPARNTSMTVFDLTFNGDMVGAARRATFDDDPGRFAVQSRWGTGGDAGFSSYDVRIDDSSAITAIDYETKSGASSASATVRVAGSSVTIDAAQMDGSASTESFELAEGGKLVIALSTCVDPLLAGLAGLQVGETFEFEALVLETFGGITLVPEKWRMLRQADDEGATVFEGTRLRGSVESTIRLIADEAGVRSMETVSQFGTALNTRRED